MDEPKKLYRTEGRAATLFGVCGGIAEYFNWDPTLVRVITALLIIPGGMSLWVYIIAALIIPRKSTVYPGY
jgi:phage shock protein C